MTWLMIKNYFVMILVYETQMLFTERVHVVLVLNISYSSSLWNLAMQISSFSVLVIFCDSEISNRKYVHMFFKER